MGEYLGHGVGSKKYELRTRRLSGRGGGGMHERRSISDVRFQMLEVKEGWGGEGRDGMLCYAVCYAGRVKYQEHDYS